MKKAVVVALLAFALLVLLPSAALATSVQTTLYYGDVVLPAGLTNLALPGSWNLNDGPLSIRYTEDLADAPNVAYNNDWSLMGIVGLFGGDSGAQMCGFLYDYNLPGVQFPTYPDNAGSLDNDDKFNLQRFPNPGSYGEGMYDVLLSGGVPAIQPAPIGSGNNYGIWFDRDGVDQWQDDMWGMVNGGTYNTSGIYDVQLDFQKVNAEHGAAWATFFPTLYNPTVLGGIYGIPTGFYSGGWVSTGADKIPAGLSFASDTVKMGAMTVHVSGSSGPGEIVIQDLVVTGYLNLDEGMATGGGWFIPDEDKFVGETAGAKATFGFVAKQSEKTGSTGKLEFQYHGDGLNLSSTAYDWVNVSATQVIFEGEGSLNGVPDYKFRVRAVDGDKLGTGIDRFEIRIWTGATEWLSPTYRMEGDLGGGQILVHKK